MDIPSNDLNFIEEVITKKIILVNATYEFNDVKYQFYDVCNTYSDETFLTERALLIRHLSPGQWNYPDEIQELDAQLKSEKKLFRVRCQLLPELRVN